MAKESEVGMVKQMTQLGLMELHKAVFDRTE